MDVRVVLWNEIPKEHWNSVLELIPIGSYIKDLPYQTNTLNLSIPIPNKTIYSNVDDEGVPITVKELQFQQVSVTNPDGIKTTVWKRTQ